MISTIKSSAIVILCPWLVVSQPDLVFRVFSFSILKNRGRVISVGEFVAAFPLVSFSCCWCLFALFFLLKLYWSDVMRCLSGACVHIWRSERGLLHRFQCHKQRQYKLVFCQSSDFFTLDRLHYQSTRVFYPERSFRQTFFNCFTLYHMWTWWGVACCKQWIMRLGETISCTEHFVQQTQNVHKLECSR